MTRRAAGSPMSEREESDVGHSCFNHDQWRRRRLPLPGFEETLLDVLRDHLGLTGAKEGCSTGDCGACSVIVDGRLVCACLVLGAEAEGRRIETIEGMATGDKLHPLQEKFLEHAALQCGICTPGFLMAAKYLLASNPDPTEEQIRFGLAGNLCRCTGYDKIVRAVQDAAQRDEGRLTMDFDPSYSVHDFTVRRHPPRSSLMGSTR